MKTEFVVCVENKGYDASLELFKIYRKVPALAGDYARGMTRVIDESGEDYLYPSKYFMPNMISAEHGKKLATKIRSVERHRIAA